MLVTAVTRRTTRARATTTTPSLVVSVSRAAAAVLGLRPTQGLPSRVVERLERCGQLLECCLRVCGRVNMNQAAAKTENSSKDRKQEDGIHLNDQICRANRSTHLARLNGTSIRIVRLCSSAWSAEARANRCAVETFRLLEILQTYLYVCFCLDAESTPVADIAWTRRKVGWFRAVLNSYLLDHRCGHEGAVFRISLISSLLVYQFSASSY